eukprot:CAMPEP_0198288570 /NCGR_PEP_ID=MMETSP1449-20131203/7025_1 /TAXON_ID=420275 /ORGANISM="Attheya septentrionalis, Strain CCMP2084" /LENGTH=231 /DNA_ID=CAMNT_0043986733 /DNA_START=308 /DNA_END=1003 /DNA_ORIENTATION=+
MVLILVVLYLRSKDSLKQVAKILDIGKSSGFRWAVAVHNLGLAVFSAVVVFHTWPIVIGHYLEKGFDAVYCDADGSLWGEAGLGAWATIFYISKYYEFLDTWVLIFKGKKPSFLQIYHHTGVVLTMWGGVTSQASWLLVVVLLNSLIHTLMYTYFFVKTLYPTMHIPYARYLTTAQIVQFLTGIIGTLHIQVRGESCASYPSRLMLGIIQTYGVGLLVLFSAFAAKKYKTK